MQQRRNLTHSLSLPTCSNSPVPSASHLSSLSIPVKAQLRKTRLKFSILEVSTLKIPPYVRHHGNLNLLPKTRPHLPHLFLHRSPFGLQCVPCLSSAALTFSLPFQPSRTSQPKCKLIKSRDSRGPPTTLPAISDPRLDAIHHRFLHRHLQRPVLHRHSSSVL